MKQRLTFHEFVTAPIPEELAEEMTYAQFVQLADPGRLQRSGQVRGPSLEIFANDRKAYHIFNFKGNPSTEGFRHHGYVAFKKPRNNQPRPSETLPVEVDCDCKDYRYRWAWANHQRGAGPIGPNSLNKSINKAPVHTNPSGKPSLCKHILAARRYIMGLIQRFPKKGEETDVDVSWKIHQLVKKAQDRHDNYDQQQAIAKKRAAIYRQGRIALNTQGPMPPEDVPANTDNEAPPPLPATVPPPPAEEGPEVPEVPPVPVAGGPQPLPRKGGNRNRNECRVVNSTNSKIMNRELLNESKALLEEMGEEIEHPGAAPAGEEFPGEVPGDTAGDLAGELPPPDEMGGGEPEDEALQLLREIATGITRLADEMAPIAAEEEAEHAEGAEHHEGEEPEPEPGEEAGVPPVKDEDEDDFQETMPVSTGA